MIAVLHPVSARGLAVHVDRRGEQRRSALRARLATLIETLDTAPATDTPTAELLARLETLLAGAGTDRIWLALAVLSGALPDQAAVLAATRAARLDGPLAGLSNVLASPLAGWPLQRGEWPRVRVVTGEVLLDLHHTAQTELATGIQRVARQSAVRWHRDHSPVLVGWAPGYRSLAELTPEQTSWALHGRSLTPGGTVAAAAKMSGDVIVPWHCTYVLPELLTEPVRAHSLLSMLSYSGSRGSMIGFDCVPLSSAETTADGMGGGFSMMLAAIAHGDRIAAISESAAAEYRGWRAMLAGAGLIGPEIAPIMLPVEAHPPSAEAVVEARRLLLAGQLPMVLCVGSHEPRKNHLAVLNAAERLWREGKHFSLVFVGGNAWHSERFTAKLAELQRAGRPVESVRGLSDDLLWAAYRLARAVIFPSLNEGFGLPVAEGLASGTPVITSNYGSMEEIAGSGGALLVDPRDDLDITGALRSILTDDELHARLSAQARALPNRTWDAYAAELWQYLVTDLATAGPPARDLTPEGTR